MAKRIPIAPPPGGNGNGINAEPAPMATLAPPRQIKKSRLSWKTAPVKKKMSFWRKLWLAIQIGFVMAVILSCVAGYFIYEKALVYYAKAENYDLKKLDDLNVTSTFVDVNGDELGRIFVEDRIVLGPDEISVDMRHAVMAAEDRRFYEHGAIDYWGILRALRENLSKKSKVQGGSTIEQQLAKHLIGDFSRTLDRKFTEAFVAVRLEKSLTKDQIMNYYLNRIYFGQGYFGVGAAAHGYFNKDAVNLTVPECALLAGIIRAPNSSSPRTDLGRAKLRRDATLKQMFDEGYIKSHEEYSRYINTPIHIQPAKPAGLQSFVMAAAVKEMEQILSIEGMEEMPQGLTVKTNINLHLQRAIEEQMNSRLSDLESAVPAAEASAPARPPLQGAAIVAEVDTGRVRAWVGGRDFAKNQFDHISMAHRENGALLQPLIYALAFDRLNLHPASMINASFLDPTASATPADLALGNPMVDLTKRFLSVQDALALGSRPAATRVALQLGVKPIGAWLKQAGLDEATIPDDKPNVFNPDPMTLEDIASLYQILGNNGVHRKLKIIQSIQSRTGQALYDDSAPDKGHSDELLNLLDVQQLTLTLQNALRSGFARTLTHDYGFKSAIAGMPGYSDGYRDAWFVGYTPKLLTGVWVGYDDSRAIGGKDVAMKSAVPLWGDIMRQTEARLPAGEAFTVPPTLSKMEIDRTTGALRGLAGLAPSPGDIFVYLKKDQIESAGNTNAAALQPPREWSDWLTTMFNESDETGLTPEEIIAPEDKRSNVIPALAEYKMPGLRGTILSSDGEVYATTRTEKNLVLGWPDAGDSATDDDITTWMRKRLDDVQQTIGVKIDVADAALVSEYRTQRYQPFTVLEDVTPDQVSKIQAAGLEGKGFGFQTAPLRHYPHGTELAHVLGYLSRSQQRNRGKYLSGDVIYDRYKGANGSGLEYVYDQDLTGKDGRFMISTTPEGYARSAAVAEPATYGHNVRLTIDSKIQEAVEQALNNAAGKADAPHKMTAAVLIDVHTGDVVAMASRPTYDPNIFLPTIAADEWNVLNNDPLIPMLDRTIHAQFPPGSSFKTVTSIAAMNAGVFDPNWVVHCTGYFDIGNIHILLPEEHGDVTYLDALTHSYNTYFMTLGLKIGRDILLDTARSLNLGSPTNIDLPGESPGLIPDSEYVKRIHQRDFGPGDVANTAIGQGDVLVTPIQMASLMAAIANNGTVYRPRLVKQIEDANGTVVKTIPTETLRTVTLDPKFMPDLIAAMVNVVDAGTATVVRRKDMKIAAKTGTAQVGSKQKPRQIAWLNGFFPADNPKYAFSVMIQGTDEDNHGFGLDDGLLGGVQGGAITKDILDTLYGSEDKKPAATSSSSKHPDAATADDDDADAGATGTDGAPSPQKKSTSTAPVTQ